MGQVRAATPADLPACAALYDRVTRETFTWLPVEDGYAKFLKEAEEEEVFVVELDGVIVGLASFYRPDNFLHSLYVEREARGTGVGSALFDHVLTTADGPVTLKVQKLNQAAIAFYRRRGLEACEEGELDQPGGGWWRMGPAGVA